MPNLAPICCCEQCSCKLTLGMACVTGCYWNSVENHLEFVGDGCSTSPGTDNCCGQVVVLGDPPGYECGDPAHPQRTTRDLCPAEYEVFEPPLMYNRPPCGENRYLTITFPEATDCLDAPDEEFYHFGWIRWTQPCDGDVVHETTSNPIHIRIKQTCETCNGVDGGCNINVTAYYCGPMGCTFLTPPDEEGHQTAVDFNCDTDCD